MTLDSLDQAFVSRWERRQETVPSAAGGPEPAPLPAASPAPSGAADPDAIASPAATSGGLIDRLLNAGRDQWAALADAVEAARLAGHRVIAVAGGEPGEGRSTLLACLTRTLRDRGREVVSLHGGEAAAGETGGPADGGCLHDKRIVLVDAGIWFRPGPIRRQRLAVASLGCDAAILVRRADREPQPARATALAAVGVAVLGEVVTFAPPAGGPAEPTARAQRREEADA